MENALPSISTPPARCIFRLSKGPVTQVGPCCRALLRCLCCHIFVLVVGVGVATAESTSTEAATATSQRCVLGDQSLKNSADMRKMKTSLHFYQSAASLFSLSTARLLGLRRFRCLRLDMPPTRSRPTRCPQKYLSLILHKTISVLIICFRKLTLSQPSDNPPTCLPIPPPLSSDSRPQQ